MNERDLLAHFPRIWHMAEDGSWKFIRRHGLLSTSALLDLYAVDRDRRFALESQRRPESVPISAKGLPKVVIRDQKPMTKSALEKCLHGGITPEEWFRLLNERVFFWLSRERLRRLLNARAYRGRPQIVLTVDTAISSPRTVPELNSARSTAVRRSTILNRADAIRSCRLSTIPLMKDVRHARLQVQWSNWLCAMACRALLIT